MVLRLTIVLAVLAALLRFVGLERKVFWDDEAIAAVYLSGNSTHGALRDSVPVTADVLQRAQALSPEGSLAAVLTNLRAEEPQLSPLYFTLGHLWGQAFGFSAGALRLFSVAISLLALGAMFVLCLELFGSARAAWLGVALAAVSPLHFLYAREAREYGLWLFLVLVQATLFLRAEKSRKPSLWALYGLISALCLYAFPFSLWIGVAQLIVLASRRGKRTPAAAPIAGFLAILAFLPWVRFDALSLARSNVGWLLKPMSLTDRLSSQLSAVYRTFFDLDFTLRSATPQGWLQLIPIGLVMALVAASLFGLFRSRDSRAKALIASLLLPTVAFTLAWDLFSGGHASSVPRYHLPVFVGLELAMVHFLLSAKRSEWTLLLLCLLGSASAIAQARSESWWNSRPGHHNRAIAETLNLVKDSLLVSREMAALMSVARYSGEGVRFAASFQETLPASLLKASRNVFLLRPTAAELRGLEQVGLRAVAVDESAGLWKVVRLAN